VHVCASFTGSYARPTIRSTTAFARWAISNNTVTRNLDVVAKAVAVLRETHQQLLDGLLTVKTHYLSRRRMLAATCGASCTAASRSASAFSIHAPSTDSASGSSGFIDDAAILAGRVRNSADDPLRSFEAFRPHYDHVHRIADVAKGATDLTLLSWVLASSGSTISRSTSLSFVISPAAAETNRMILSGRATGGTRRTISFSRVSST